MARRGENIYKRKDGRWEGRIPNGYQRDGRKKYRSVYDATYAGVKAKMKEAAVAQQNVPGRRAVLMEDALRLWLEDRKNYWKPSTYACYIRLVERQLLPCVGSVLIQQFDSACMNALIEQKREERLSDSYIRDMTNILLQSMRHLKDVYQYQLAIPFGVPNKSTSFERKLPSRSTMTALEQYLTEHMADSTCLGILLCCYTGLRIGELCALQWTDIDMERGLLHVCKTMQRITVYEQVPPVSRILITTPKTKQSMRDIPIPPGLLTPLRRYRGGDEEYVIQGRKTAYAEPRTVQYRFKSILLQCNINPFNFHMLRHVFATRCIMLGFDVNTLSELLGHSSVQITLNRYVHSSNERKRYLMEQFQL